MLFSNSDMELLRLSGWCKNLPANVEAKFHSQVFDLSGIRLLEKLELMNVTKNEKSIRLREKGWNLLRNMGMDFHRDTVYKHKYVRRLEMSWLLLTFWRAGFNVYGSTLRDLDASQVFLHSSVARRSTAPGGNIWGGAVFWGLARLRNSVISCYHVGGNEDMTVNFRYEKDMLDKAALMLELKGAMLYAGSDYERLARAVRNNGNTESGGIRRTFAEIYRAAVTPLYLLECSDAGALQLLIMMQEDYRRRLADAMFRLSASPDKLASPPIGVTDADGLLTAAGGVSIPWVLAIDMDIVRIGRFCRQSSAAGYSGSLIICLPKQEKALSLLFGGSGAKIVMVSEENLLNAFGALRLYEPAPGAYHDAKGGMLNAAHLPVN